MRFILGMNIGFTSTEFILLLPIVALAYYLIPCRCRQSFLLVINILFYASFGASGLIVIAIEAAIVYAYSILLTRRQNSQVTLYNAKASITTKRKAYSVVCVVTLLLVLVFFKFVARLGESIVAPLGLSFFTLAAVSYVIDLSKGELEPELNFIKLITWLTFFPTITSGPIYRYKTFIKEYNRNVQRLNADYDRIIKGIIYMIYGYFLKLVIAERAAIPVNYVFDNLGAQYFNFLILIVVAISYSIQIYADFAGYSAMVIGIAQILGYYVPENFCAPYLSASIKEFWGRWHISLSTWLRDYVYIPLGGNRKGKLRKYVNILITFIVSGLWHGTRLHFLIWGAMHALFQISGDITANLRAKLCHVLRVKDNSFAISVIKRVNTFILATIAWLFFRTGVKDAIFFIEEIFKATSLDKENIWLFAGLGIEWSDWGVLLMATSVMVIVDVLMYKKKRIDEWLMNKQFIVRGPALIVMLLFILIFGIYGDQHDASYFIYRGF